ncbi:transcriptional regulator [Cupriavidus sp. YAF13]|uniref:transcriptional regulator n=1 Tax=Cupriavidus sp. YAF13 TaxID=3233075 RepID=UPI003F8EABFB
MDLKTYLATAGITQKQFADQLGVTQSLVAQWLRGVKPPIKRCVQIERLSGAVVTRQALRVDWLEIWPELKPPPPTDGED